jgi:diaminopimelate epimerase
VKLDFIKIHGAGNDFIVVDDFSSEIELTPSQVQLLCDRHFGIGADGVILVRPSVHSDCAAYMHYINSDGSLAEMCGNGVRCFAKFLVDFGFVQAAEGAHGGSFIADTRAGKRPISFELDATGKLVNASIDMGEPIFAPEQIPTSLPATSSVELVLGEGLTRTEAVVHLEQSNMSLLGDAQTVLESSLTAEGTQALQMVCVNMGNPHAVIFLDGGVDLESYDVAAMGSLLEKNRVLFPEGTNVEFAVLAAEPHAEYEAGTQEENVSTITMRVWERGCGETLACGTGACATAVAAMLFKRAQRSCILHLRGGDLHIEWRNDNHVYMTGPARSVYQGSIDV